MTELNKTEKKIQNDEDLRNWVIKLQKDTWQLGQLSLLHEISEYVEEHHQLPLKVIEGMILEAKKEPDPINFIVLNNKLIKEFQESATNG